jgi:hypothetical protein
MSSDMKNTSCIGRNTKEKMRNGPDDNKAAMNINESAVRKND